MNTSADGSQPFFSVRRWQRLPEEIRSAGREAILNGQTNKQVAETLNDLFPGLGMTGVYAANFRRSLRKDGISVLTSRDAGRSQKLPQTDATN